MKKVLSGTIFFLVMSFAAQAGLVATLQEGENDSVYFSIDVTNPVGFDYSGFDAKHLEYIFFDNVGDYAKGSVFGNNPTIFQPVSHGFVGTSFDGFSIGIQALAIDNDTGNDLDDFVLRFIGQTPGLTNNTTPLNFEQMLDFDSVRIRNLNFSALNEGLFTSTDAQAAAVGGFSLKVQSLTPLSLPTMLPIFFGGLLIIGLISRRRKPAF